MDLELKAPSATLPIRADAVWNARLALRFAVKGARTRMSVDAQEPPWKVLRAFELAKGGALVHLHNVSGGILEWKVLE